jgi:hypothetical protein
MNMADHSRDETAGPEAVVTRFLVSQRSLAKGLHAGRESAGGVHRSLHPSAAGHGARSVVNFTPVLRICLNVAPCMTRSITGLGSTTLAPHTAWIPNSNSKGDIGAPPTIVPEWSRASRILDALNFDAHECAPPPAGARKRRPRRTRSHLR